MVKVELTLVDKSNFEINTCFGFIDKELPREVSYLFGHNLIGRSVHQMSTLVKWFILNRCLYEAVNNMSKCDLTLFFLIPQVHEIPLSIRMREAQIELPTGAAIGHRRQPTRGPTAELRLRLLSSADPSTDHTPSSPQRRAAQRPASIRFVHFSNGRRCVGGGSLAAGTAAWCIALSSV